MFGNNEIWKPYEPSVILEGWDKEMKFFDGEQGLILTRRLGTVQNYHATLFLAKFPDSDTLEKQWSHLNNAIAVYCQSVTESLIERSNFYLCLFTPDEVSKETKSIIESDAYCAKKYLFKIEEGKDDWESLAAQVEERIFSLDIHPDKAEKPGISALKVRNFRAFSGEKTFQFTHEKSGEAASLVVVYARNGTGKTSLCDSVEWALTDTVDRLVEIEANTQNKPRMVLRNDQKYKSIKDYTKAKETAFVELRIGSKDTLRRVVGKGTGNNKETDLNRPNFHTVKSTLMGNLAKEKLYNSGSEKNSVWQQVLLPHHKIESFISATDPTTRFEDWLTFVDEDGEKKRTYETLLDDYAEAVKAYNAAEKEVSKAQQELEGLKESCDAVKPLFEAIDHYNRLVKDANLLDFPEDGDIESFQQLVSEASYRKEQAEETQKKLLGILDELSGLAEEQGASLAKLLEEKEQSSLNYKEKERLLNAVVKYQEQKRNLETAQQARDSLIQELFDLKRQREEGGSTERLRKNNQQYVSTKASLREKEKQKTDIENTLNSLREAQKKRERQLDWLKVYALPKELSKLTNIMESCPKEYPVELPLEELTALAEQYADLSQDEQKQRKELYAQETLEGELRKLVEQGREYLKAHQTDGPCQCPLCHTEFPNWVLLFQSTVSQSNALSRELATALRRTGEEMGKLQKQYTEILENHSSSVLRKKSEISGDFSIADLAMKMNNRKLEQLRDEIADLEEELNKLSREAFALGWEEALPIKEEWLTRFQEKEQNDLTKKIEDIEPEQERLESEITRLSEELKKSAELEGLTVADCCASVKQAQQFLEESRQAVRRLEQLAEVPEGEPLTLSMLEQTIQRLKTDMKQLVLQKEQLLRISVSPAGEYFRSYQEKLDELANAEKALIEAKKNQIAAKKRKDENSKNLKKDLELYFSDKIFKQMYDKIAPHPDIGSIDYKVDFEERPGKKPDSLKYIPTLKILVKDKNNVEYPPELFFSTAQLNVVTLSAFLSRALSSGGNSLPLSTIMIDDPVGHFDDMNILDFSDLIRCVLEQTGKQIILTTHDETVYRILRRKLSPEYYRSRFINMMEQS